MEQQSLPEQSPPAYFNNRYHHQGIYPSPPGEERRPWDFDSPTAYLGAQTSPSSPPTAAYGVPYIPFPRPRQDLGAGENTPTSSVGLGIDAVAPSPGYPLNPLKSIRDPYQLDSNESYDQSKGRIFQSERLLSSPEDIAAHGQHYPDVNRSRRHPNSSRSFPPSWRWRWVGSAWPLYSTFCLGIIFAGCHHSLYDRLDGREATDQINMIRWGGLFSYLSKACLVASVVFTYRQQIWATVRRKALNLKTIDSLFAAVDEPAALLNKDFLKEAKLAVTLAILVWLFPLTVILTPATLTVGPIELKNDSAICYGVRTLNFENEMHKNWRKEDRIRGYRGVSVSLWNCTLPDSDQFPDEPFNNTYFDYWTGSSFQIDLVMSRSALMGTVIPMSNVALETCGPGWNCTYNISFTGPGYKCEELARGAQLDEEKMRKKGVPFNTSDLIPRGNFSYIAHTKLGDYSPQQMENYTEGTPGAPNITPPWPENFGAFRTEPLLWIGYSIATPKGSDNGTKKPPTEKSDSRWNIAFEASVHRCEHWLAEYTVQFNQTLETQTTKVIKRKFLHRIIDTEYLPDKPANDGTWDNTTAVPESNYVFPLDVERYRLIAAYHSVGSIFRRFLNGTIQYFPYANPATDITKTNLINKDIYLPWPNLIENIQHLYENMTLSMLSDPELVAVSWAHNRSRSGVTEKALEPYNTTGYNCTKTRIVNAYIYNRRDLWIAYTIAIVVTLLSVILGAASLAQNNHHVRDVHVSSIVAATRAPCLDSLPWKSSKWGEVPKEIMETRLGYGVIVDSGPNGTPALGRVNTDGNAISGKVYYGFAPPEVLKVSESALGRSRPRSRMSIVSFRTWDSHHGR